MDRAIRQQQILSSKNGILIVSDRNLVNDALKLIVQPSSREAVAVLQTFGFQTVPSVASLVYREMPRSQVPELLLNLSQRLSPREKAQSRFILTQSSFDSSAFLVEFLHAQPLSNTTLMLENGWFLQVLAKEELFFHYQPIFDLTSGRVIAYECLARAANDEGQQFNGHQLIQAALRLDLTHEFDSIARSACLEALAALYSDTQWLDAPPTFFVNLLPNAIAQNPKSLERNFQQVLDLGLRSEQIVFELTEVEALGNHPDLPRLIEQIRAWGFGLALDDLGSNVALDHYCTEFRPDIIKLDRRLVQGCSRYILKQIMMKSLLQFAHELDITVLAEGLETQEDIEFCQAIGIDLGQGYGLGVPETMPWQNLSQMASWELSKAS